MDGGYSLIEPLTPKLGKASSLGDDVRRGSLTSTSIFKMAFSPAFDFHVRDNHIAIS